MEQDMVQAPFAPVAEDDPTQVARRRHRIDQSPSPELPPEGAAVLDAHGGVEAEPAEAPVQVGEEAGLSILLAEQDLGHETGAVARQPRAVR